MKKIAPDLDLRDREVPVTGSLGERLVMSTLIFVVLTVGRRYKAYASSAKLCIGLANRVLFSVLGSWGVLKFCEG